MSTFRFYIMLFLLPALVFLYTMNCTVPLEESKDVISDETTFVCRMPMQMQELAVSPDGQHFSFVSPYNAARLEIRDFDGQLKNSVEFIGSYSSIESIRLSYDNAFILYRATNDQILVTSVVRDSILWSGNSLYFYGDYGWLPHINNFFLSSNSNSKPTVYVFDLQGNRQEYTVSGAEYVYNLSWAPDAQRFLFRGKFDNKQSLCLFSMQTQTFTTIIDSVQLQSTPAWSSDGEQIAVAHRIDGRSFIDVINLPDNTRRRYYANYNPQILKWKSDGSGLLFTTSFVDGRFITALSFMDSSLTVQNSTLTQDYIQSVNADDETYQTVRDVFGYRAVWLYTIADEKLHSVTYDDKHGYEYCPTWKPDGKKLAYIDGSTAMEYDIQDETHKIVAPDIRARSLEYSPDGRSLLITESRDIVLYSNNDSRLISFFPTKDKRYGTATWSPDGLRIAATDERDSLYIFDLGDTLTLHKTIPGRFTNPSWSRLDDPQFGSYILYETHDSLCAIDPFTEIKIKIFTQAPLHQAYCWSADGRDLLYNTFYENRIIRRRNLFVDIP